MKKLFALTCAAIPALIIALPACARSTPQIAQALIGLTGANGTAPCVGDGTAACYGIPNGAVALQPDMLPAPGASSTWYAVFQTAAWSGSLSVSFELLESGASVQTAAGSATAAQNSTILVTVPQSVPSNGYSGAATLAVTTTATPTGGGTPATLKSAVEIEVGATPAHQVVIALAGPSGFVSDTNSPPCIGGEPGSCYNAPAGVAVAWPLNVSAPSDAIWYAIFQAGDWRGGFQGSTFTLTERGAVVATLGGPSSGGGPSGLAFTGAVVLPVSNGYAGPATFGATTTAIGRHGNSKAKLACKAPVVVLAPPAS